jgi:hypothetical protein
MASAASEIVRTSGAVFDKGIYWRPWLKHAGASRGAEAYRWESLPLFPNNLNVKPLRIYAFPESLRRTPEGTDPNWEWCSACPSCVTACDPSTWWPLR